MKLNLVCPVHKIGDRYDIVFQENLLFFQLLLNGCAKLNVHIIRIILSHLKIFDFVLLK